MTVILEQVKINGTDVFDYTTDGTVVRKYRQTISELNITLRRDVTDVVTPAAGDTITFKRGNSPADDTYFLFEGSVVDVKKDFGTFSLKCYDKLYDLVNKEVHKSYDINIDPEAGEITAIIKDMIETFGDLTADIKQASGLVNVLERFVCRHADVYEKCVELLEIIGYQMYYDATSAKVIVEPKGFTTATDAGGDPLVLRSDVTGETDNIIEPAVWKENAKRLFNNLVVEGAVSEVETTETFDGDTIETDFDLLHIPVSVKVFISDVLKTGGVEGSTGSFDYTVDRRPEGPKIVFVSPPTGGSDNIEVRYSYDVPVPVNATDDVSIATYGEIQEVHYLPATEKVNDAQEIGQALIDRFSIPFVTATCKIDDTVVDIDPGELLRIDDDINNEDRQLVILQIKHKIPYKPDELTLGDEEYKTEDWGRDILMKIKRLNEKLTGDDDLLTTLINTNLNLGLAQVSEEILSKKAYDSFMYGNAINGLYGMGTILDSMEAVGNWADGGGTVTFSLAADTDHVQERTNALKLTWSGETPSTTGQIVDATTSLGDLSAYTGESSGTPSQGTVGMWIYLNDSGDITSDITLRLGSSSSDYTEMTGREYTSGGYELETATWVTGWNYVMFDLDGGSETGTPDWTAVDYSRIEFTVGVAAESLWIDYYTISKSNFIALNGFGDRQGTEVQEVFHTW